MIGRHNPGLPSNADRTFQPTESWDLYRLQSIRRVPAGQPVWTREYGAALVRDVGTMVAILLATIVVVGAVGAILAFGDGSLTFVAGGLALAMLFGLALRSVMRVDTAYATAEEAAASTRLMPDMAGLEEAYAADLRDRIEARRTRGRELILRRERLLARITRRPMIQAPQPDATLDATPDTTLDPASDATPDATPTPARDTADLAPVIPIRGRNQSAA